MILDSTNTGLKFAVVVSLFCHIFCFRSVELTFGKKVSESCKFSKIFFLGSILPETDYSYSRGESENDYSESRLNARIYTDILRLKSSPIYELCSDFKKPQA